MPLCQGCRSQLATIPFPLWIKLIAAVVFGMVLFSSYSVPASLAARLAFERGFNAERSGKYAEAINQYQIAQQHFPESTKILSRQTIAYFKGGLIPEAMVAAKKLQGRTLDKKTLKEMDEIINQLATQKMGS